MKTHHNHHRQPDFVLFRSQGIIMSGHKAYSTVIGLQSTGLRKDLVRFDYK
jgi:hypothetical protein